MPFHLESLICSSLALIYPKHSRDKDTSRWYRQCWKKLQS